MPRRPAYTLIELIATMGLTSAVLGLLAGWLVSVMRHQAAAGEHLLEVTTQIRLARQFRQDVRDAHALEPADLATPELKLRLQRKEGEIRYVASGRLLERREIREGKVQRQEQYRISPADVQFEHSSQGPAWVALLVHRTRAKENMALRIEAAIGSGHRYERRDE